ncbi:flagellar assembly protein FliT [Pseudomonas sp. 1D4]|uniref:flagellar assembly protein FliT n=1 Tax=Pseudomonadaceae TaxID=135621 RepID=UPI00084B8DAE|nr:MULTISPECIES: flagellar assembly protein FliT [Pseudomonas]OEC44367.1 flagellar assembly protein FliT [Pseudomonas sp. 1D4]
MSQTMLKQIEETREALVSAFESQDWEAVGRLDLQCREQVNVAMLDCSDIEEGLRAQLEALIEVYRQLTESCARQRDEVAAELSQIVRASQGAKVYQLFG